MARSYPDAIPTAYADYADAYRRGWNHGHGIACHDVPRLGAQVWVERMGRVTVDAENIRDVHACFCFVAESYARSYSPFEFTAHEFNSSDDAEELWEAFEAGVSDAIFADLAEYTDEDYDIGVVYLDEMARCVRPEETEEC